MRYLKGLPNVVCDEAPMQSIVISRCQQINLIALKVNTPIAFSLFISMLELCHVCVSSDTKYG
jgi:hypothetical protein